VSLSNTYIGFSLKYLYFLGHTTNYFLRNSGNNSVMEKQDLMLGFSMCLENRYLKVVPIREVSKAGSRKSALLSGKHSYWYCLLIFLFLNGQLLFSFFCEYFVWIWYCWVNRGNFIY